MALTIRSPLKLLLQLLLVALMTSAAAAQLWSFDPTEGPGGDPGLGLYGGAGDLQESADSVDRFDESGVDFAGSDSAFDEGQYASEESQFELSEDEYEDGEYGYEDPGYGYEDDGYGYEDGGYGYEDGGYGYEDPGYGYEDDGYGYEDGGYGFEDGGYGYEDPGYGFEDGGYGYEDSGYGYEDSGYGYEDSGYGYEDSGYGYEDSGYGYEDSGYGYEDSGYGYEDGGYGYEDGGYGYEDGGYEYEDREYRSRRGRHHGRRGCRGGGREGHRGGRGGCGRPVQARSEEVAQSEVGTPDIEFDDGTASADEIPQGYFSQQEVDNQRPGGPVTGGIDMPGFRIIIGSARQWWKYNRNVCLRKEILRPSELDHANRRMSMYSLRCGQNSATEYSCVVNQWNGTHATSQRLTYTCCPGFTRLVGDRGCPRNVINSSSSDRTFAELLRGRGYSWRAIELFTAVMNSSDSVRKQWTVFVPEREALERTIDEFQRAGVAEAGKLVRAMLNHFAKPAMRTQLMRHGQAVPTLAKPSSLLISKTGRGDALVNCQPILHPNQAFNRYSLAHFTTRVLAINKLNLYELMLQRLETATSADSAKRLLAPLKSTLTGSGPFTVFMHLPAADELDNGCYAKNIRAVLVKGAECETSLLSVRGVRSIDGKVIQVHQESDPGSRIAQLLIDGNRLVTDADQLASNGVLHLVSARESLTGFRNEAARRLKSSPTFRPLFSRPNLTEFSLALLVPRINGSHSYENTSARWSNAEELVRFGRRHLVENASCSRSSTCRLPMLDGERRDFVQLFQRRFGASIFSPGRLVKRRFVDCVPVASVAKDCAGTAYFLLRGELPSFNLSPTAMDYLSSSSRDDYSMTKTILSFGLQNNINGLADAMRRSDVSILLVKDGDLAGLSGRLLLRRRRPTDEQMTELVEWFVRYFVAPRKVCALKQLSPSLRVPAFRVDLRPCRSFVCAMRRQITRELKLVALRPGSQVAVREGFLIPGRVLRSAR